MTIAHDAHPSTGDHDLHHDQDERPHVCTDGWVSMEVEVLDPDTGEEILEEALYFCRRCAERS